MAKQSPQNARAVEALRKELTTQHLALAKAIEALDEYAAWMRGEMLNGPREWQLGEARKVLERVQRLITEGNDNAN